jgi:hypothetical protein
MSEPNHHAVHKGVEMLMTTPQGQAVTGMAVAATVAAAPVVVPAAIAVALGWGIHKLFKWMG